MRNPEQSLAIGTAMLSPNVQNVSLMDASLLSHKSSSCQVDSEFRYSFFTISYSLIFILGFAANCYVLWVFTRVYPTRRLSEIKIFMVNLTMADLLFLITMPLWIVYYHNRGNWIMPSFLCNLAGCFFFINTYCSVAFLGVISYNRFQAVTRPVETAQSTARKRGIFISCIIWILVVSCASYFLYADSTNVKMSEEGNLTRCFEEYSSDDGTLLVVTHFILIGVFFIIFLIILVCNLIIIRTLLSQPGHVRQSASVKQRALWMVCTVLAVFIICFVPHHIIHGPWTLTVLEMWQKDNCALRQTFNDAHQVTLCLMSTNCTLDPIIYCFLTKKFRRHLMEHIKSMGGSRKCSRQTTETGLEGGMVPLNELARNSTRK
ncbi:platelet-activating factor receptor [Rhinatrema bivittatum]|uniref:platelet-activating factor receptor n=1 Tax=Rhinatrema bivittatum TaxID=194408 RepID=UPI001125D58F|nr:platelet-activating factor receptor [Rhinatrema bivittatum]XP_029427241.1 platelet-activating factor receptor [Rhinatrema bivittatum]